MELRRTQKEYVNEIVEIMYQIQKLHEENRPDVFKEKTREDIEKEVCIILADEKEYVIVALNNNCVCGVLICNVKEVKNHRNLKDSKSLWIDELGVYEKYRKNGIGRELMKYAENLSKQLNCKTITLNCWSFNEVALQFYEKQGMKNQRIILEKEMEEEG